MAEQDGQRIGPPLWVSVLVYAALSALLTWPLVQHLSTHFPSLDTDAFNVFWGNWWVRQALGSLQNPYVTNYLIYPVGFNLLSFAFSPFLALLWTPLSWIVPPIAANNLVLLLTIVLCCVSMDQLVRYLTGNGWAGLVAGVTFGFAPSLMAERLSHMNLAALLWIPWAALLLTRILHEARIRDALLLPVVFGLAFLTRPQVGALVVLTCGLYFIGLALVEVEQWHRLGVRRLLVAGLLSLLILSPLLLFGLQTLQQPGAESLLREDASQYQADLLSYVVPPQRHPVFGSRTAAFHDRRFAGDTGYWAYLGVVPLLLAVYAVLTRPRKAFPWLLTGLVLLILALGPHLRFNGDVYPEIKLPYAWASRLFSTLGLNWPKRFNLALMSAMGALAGLACAHLYERIRKAWLLGLTAVLIVAEYLVVPLAPGLAPPGTAFYDAIAADGQEYALVDWPLTRAEGEVHRYFQTLHGKPIVGGWDHRVPESAFDFIDSIPLLAAWRENDQPVVTLDQDLASLSEANVRYIVIHKRRMPNTYEHMRTPLFALRPVYEDYWMQVLPVESGSAQGYHVVHHFEGGPTLIQPTVAPHIPEGELPQISVYACWWRGGEGDRADRTRMTLTGPQGTLLYEVEAPLPHSPHRLVCQHHPFELNPPLQAGEYQLGLTPLAGSQPLGTYAMPLPVQVIPVPGGDAFPAAGHAQKVAFDAPIELLGYHAVGGDNFVWVDLLWRATAEHVRSYEQVVHLTDPTGGQSLASASGPIQYLVWSEGIVSGERVVVWADGVPPGDYTLAVSLRDTTALDGQSGEPLPGNMAVLDVPVRVLPATARDLPPPQDGAVIIYAAP